MGGLPRGGEHSLCKRQQKIVFNFFLLTTHFPFLFTSIIVSNHRPLVCSFLCFVFLLSPFTRAIMIGLQLVPLVAFETIQLRL